MLFTQTRATGLADMQMSLDAVKKF